MEKLRMKLYKIYQNINKKSFLDGEYGLEAYKILDKLSNAKKIKN